VSGVGSTEPPRSGGAGLAGAGAGREVIAALDIGGSHVSAARVDLRAGATEPGTTFRITYRPGASRTELLQAIVGAAASVARGVERLGVAAPGPFDYERGVCKVAGLAKLEALYDVDLRHELRPVLDGGTEVSFLNDAEAFLLGEVWAGAAGGHARAVGITLGTGLGSAFAVEGRILSEGATVPPEGSLHLVPFRGVPVEDSISARGLLARHPGTVDGVAELARIAGEGDPRALELFEQLGLDLGDFLDPWLEGFGAECLVVGGSIANAWPLFGPALQRALARVRSLELVARAVNLDEAPLLGAARHAAGGGR
jgi:glucokinase